MKVAIAVMGWLSVLSLVGTAATARELPPIEHSRCKALAVNLSLRSEPLDEYGRVVVEIGREVIEDDRRRAGDDGKSRRAFELELYKQRGCEELTGIAAP